MNRPEPSSCHPELSPESLRQSAVKVKAPGGPLSPETLRATRHCSRVQLAGSLVTRDTLPPPNPVPPHPCPAPKMMRVDVTKFNKKFGICKMDAKAYVGEDVVCEAELTLVMGK